MVLNTFYNPYIGIKNCPIFSRLYTYVFCCSWQSVLTHQFWVYRYLNFTPASIWIKCLLSVTKVATVGISVTVKLNEGNVLFNDKLNTFLLHGIGCMVKGHRDDREETGVSSSWAPLTGCSPPNSLGSGQRSRLTNIWYSILQNRQCH